MEIGDYTSAARCVNIGYTAMDSEMPAKRKYELKKRAGEVDETRRRITEAAVRLHGTVGPSRTTMSAVAKLAGVQRHTVYRHFPTEADLFGACSAHYFTANPWPGLEPWRAITDPSQRLARALDELYDYYARTEAMFSNVMRDIELVDAIPPTMAPMQTYLAEAVGILAAGWPARGRRRHVLAAALNLALDFQVWRSLTANNQVSRSEAVELITALVEAAAAPSRRATASPLESKDRARVP